MKICKCCGSSLSIESFRVYGRPRVNGSRYRRLICTCCENAENRKRRENNIEETRKYYREVYVSNLDKERKRNRNKSVRFRFSRALRSSRNKAAKRGHIPCLATVEELEVAFTGKCCACGLTEVEHEKMLCIDHNHETGEFRGWLCVKCNFKNVLVSV